MQSYAVIRIMLYDCINVNTQSAQQITAMNRLIPRMGATFFAPNPAVTLSYFNYRPSFASSGSVGSAAAVTAWAASSRPARGKTAKTSSLLAGFTSSVAWPLAAGT
jgi:hypothetical protein